MKDDFDSGMGIPDDELAGESAMSEGDTLGGSDGDVELEAPEREPVGRASGGARAMSSGKSAAPRKAAAAKKAAPAKARSKKAPADPPTDESSTSAPPAKRARRRST